MTPIIRKPTHSQWIMWMSVAAIAIFMGLASKAQAFYSGSQQGATTLSHCGFIPARDVIYTERSSNTRIIQSKLEQLGYSVGSHGIDGVYGRDTRDAVRTFQKEYGLSPDGIVAGQTVTLLAYNTHPSDNVRRCRRPVRGSH